MICSNFINTLVFYCFAFLCPTYLSPEKTSGLSICQKEENGIPYVVINGTCGSSSMGIKKMIQFQRGQEYYFNIRLGCHENTRKKRRFLIKIAIDGCNQIYWGDALIWDRIRGLAKKTNLSSNKYCFVGREEFKINEYDLHRSMHKAICDGDALEALHISNHYRRWERNIIVSQCWRFIAMKLGSQEALSEWWRDNWPLFLLICNKNAFKFQARPLFFALLSYDDLDAGDEYGYYARYIAALLRDDYADAALHLKRLRELGVTEKLLENPLTLPGMEDAP